MKRLRSWSSLTGSHDSKHPHHKRLSSCPTSFILSFFRLVLSQMSWYHCETILNCGTMGNGGLPRWHSVQFSSVQFSSVAQSCPTLCDPMNCRTAGLPVHHQLLEFAHTHVHRVGDTIQPSHPLLYPSPPALNASQHQSFPMSQLFA